MINEQRPDPGDRHGAARLWGATAGVLSAVGTLVDVAREICEDKREQLLATPPQRGRPTAPAESNWAGAPEPNHRRFEPVDLVDAPPDLADDLVQDIES